MAWLDQTLAHLYVKSERIDVKRYQQLIWPGFACALENEVEWQNCYYWRK